MRIGRQFYDRFVDLQDLQRQTGVEVQRLAQLMGGASGHGDAIIERLYEPIMKSVKGEWADLETFMVIRHLEELYSRAPSQRDFVFPREMASVPGIGNIGELFEAKRLLIDRLTKKGKLDIVTEAADELDKINKEQVIGTLVREGLLESDPGWNHS